MWVLPILTRSLNSVLLASSAPCSFFKPGKRRSWTSNAAAMCIAVGNVSLELYSRNTVITRLRNEKNDTTKSISNMRNNQYYGFPAKWPLRNKCRNSILMMWLLRSGKSFWLVEASFLPGTTNQKHYTYLGGDASSVWNFCTCSSDIILWGNQWRRHEMLAVFSGIRTLIIREILEILL